MNLGTGLSPWRRSAALLPGAPVALIAPSGPLPVDRFQRGLEVLAKRYTPLRSEGLLSRQGFLAGTDRRRLCELRWALSDPAVHAVFAGRGGHGLLRSICALDAICASELRPVPLVGFSDITVLHAFLAQRQVISIHGPVVTQLGELPEQDVSALFALLEQAAPPPPLEGLCAVRTPAAADLVHGRLLGGNIEVLSRLCGTALGTALCANEPVVLLLEEVSEAPYRIDRALTQMLLSGALRNVRAFLVGDLVRCDASGDDAPSALAVIAERAAQIDAVVVAGVPLGHGARNHPLPLGARVTLEARRGRLLFHDGAVVC